jgi:ribosomal protein L24E
MFEIYFLRRIYGSVGALYVKSNDLTTFVEKDKCFSSIKEGTSR